MYEAVHAYPDGEATVARHAATAARHGYDGIVVRTREALDPVAGGERSGDGGSSAGDRDRSPVRDPDALAEEYGIDVVDAVEVDADDPTSASGAVGNYRSDRTVVCVGGGDDALNRFAVEQPRVDVLVRPTAGGGDFNHVLAKAARDNGVRRERERPLAPRTAGAARAGRGRRGGRVRRRGRPRGTPGVGGPRRAQPRAPLRGLHRAGGPTWQV